MFFAKKYNLDIIDVGSKQSVEAYTDYPLTKEEIEESEKYNTLCAKSPEGVYPPAPKKNMKKIKVISYDRDKYCLVLYRGEIYHIKCGYCYHRSLRGHLIKWADYFSYETIGKERNKLPYLANKDPDIIEELKIIFHKVFR